MKKYQAPIQTSEELAEVKLAYKSRVKPADRAYIDRASAVIDYLRKIWDEDSIEHVESFYVLMLNRANKVLGWALVSKGGTSGTVADPKVIFQHAILCNASYLIIAHNHPSGNLRPSTEDIRLTNKLVEAGKLLDMLVVDHVILTANSSLSFADEGLL